jgi:Fanconi-associated nuclease 1
MLGKLVGKRSAPGGAKASASPSKKIKAHGTPSPMSSPRRPQWQSNTTAKREIPDSEAEDEDSMLDAVPEEADEQTITGLEKAMPPIKTDKEAIKEYEELRASEGAQLQELEERLGQRKWTRGKSSIYVDAFNLALETVLDEESHLFDAAETKVFEAWRGLQYEAQYL